MRKEQVLQLEPIHARLDAGDVRRLDRLFLLQRAEDRAAPAIELFERPPPDFDPADLILVQSANCGATKAANERCAETCIKQVNGSADMGGVGLQLACDAVE